MDKKILTAIIVALLLNVTVILIGFGYLQNEINQLKNENLSESTVQTPTEASSPETSDQLVTNEDSQTTVEPEETETSEPQEPTTESQEPADEQSQNQVNNVQTNKKTANKLEEPIANLDVKVSLMEAKVSGNIENPNSATIYNVSLRLSFSGTLTYGLMPMSKIMPTLSITVGTMEGNEVIPITETIEFFDLRDTYLLSGEYNGYSVYWDELE